MISSNSSFHITVIYTSKRLKSIPDCQKPSLIFIFPHSRAIEEYMSEKVTHVITDSPWDDNFDQALSDNPNLHFVKPKWILSCYEKQKLVPHQKFVVVPT